MNGEGGLVGCLSVVLVADVVSGSAESLISVEMEEDTAFCGKITRKKNMEGKQLYRLLCDLQRVWGQMVSFAFLSSWL